MRHISYSTIAACLTLASSVSAKDGPVPAGEIKRMAVGHTVSGAMYYGPDGHYTYNGANPGTYKISTGRICVNFDDGHSRCDSIVRSGADIFLVNQNGEHYPFTPE